MNPHYHHQPYPDLNSPHSPNSDGVPSSYLGHTPIGGPPNGHIMGSHHDHMHQHPAYTTGGPNPLAHHNNGPNSLNNYHHHHHYHQYLNNSNSNSSSNNNNNNNNNNINNSNNNSNNSNQNSNMNIQHHTVKIHSAMCAGCNSKIMDRYVFEAMNCHWHKNCLKCHKCRVILADRGDTCFIKGQLILCKNDYYKECGYLRPCSGCGTLISTDDYVMRPMNPPSVGPPRGPLVYHVNCFTCVKCKHRLQSGEKYHMLPNGNPVCEKDWPVMYKAAGGIPTGQQPAAGTTVRKGKVGRPRRPRD